VIVDYLMESNWPGDPERDEALYEAIHTTLGLSSFCAVLAEQCSAETDERTATTIRVVRKCAHVCQATMVTLARWETGDLDALRGAVDDCVIACEEAIREFDRYLPEMNPIKHGGAMSYDTMFCMRKTREVSLDCKAACERFLQVWFGT
jgi:hypothetical protein